MKNRRRNFWTSSSPFVVGRLNLLKTLFCRRRAHDWTSRVEMYCDLVAHSKYVHKYRDKQQNLLASAL
jgi:hypothetical protein